MKIITAVGLDLSLTHTGYAIVQSNGSILDSGIIKSKPEGESPLHETGRIVNIAEQSVRKIDETLPSIEPSIIVIEGLAFMARNTTALVQLAGLNYLVRTLLSQFKWPFIIVAPTSLKKFITGSGKGEKDKMMMIAFKEYNFEALDNNVNDAFCLAVCGLATLGSPLKKLNKPQQEVVTLLKKQIKI